MSSQDLTRITYLTYLDTYMYMKDFTCVFDTFLSLLMVLYLSCNAMLCQYFMRA